jgi:hypothetical protein
MSESFMVHPLLLSSDPVDDMEASTKRYSDAQDALVRDYADAQDVAQATGITDGSDAQPGEIGEYIVVDNMVGITPPANTPMTVCAITLTPGCWEVWGTCDFTIAALITLDPLAGAPVMPNQLGSGISVTTDSLPTDEELILGTGVMNLLYSPLAAGQRQVLITGQCRSNSTDPVTLYLVAAVGSANATVKGYISARRVR